MAEQPAQLHPAPSEPDEELLDRIDALRVLRADSPEERGRLLEEIGRPRGSRAGSTGNPIGLPAFLLTGAFVSGIASGLQGFARSAVSTPIGVVVTGLFIVFVLVALAWVALFSAGVARRRIRLSTDQPMRALWDTIGAAGKPPKDESYNFAVYAIILIVLAWIVIPLVAWRVFGGSNDVTGSVNLRG